MTRELTIAWRAGCTIAALALLAGCSEDADGNDRSSVSPPAVSTTATTTPAPRTSDAAAVTDPGERVVVLAEEFMLADVLSLGVRPVASTASVEQAGFQGLDEFDTTGIDVLPMTTLSLERLASIEPDTIVTLQLWADQFGADTLAAMADLIVVPDGLAIPERLTLLGDELRRADEAAAMIAKLDDATAATAAAVPDDCTLSLAAIYPGPSPAAFVDGPWEIPTSILATGCTLDPDPTVAAPDENGRVFLSLEQLGLLDAPMIVLLQSDTVDGESAAVAEIQANPLWAQLPAVQAGNVVVMDRLGYPGATGQIEFLEDFTALFT